MYANYCSFQGELRGVTGELLKLICESHETEVKLFMPKVKTCETITHQSFIYSLLILKEFL